MLQAWVQERGGGCLSQTRRKPIPGGSALPSLAMHGLGKTPTTPFAKRCSLPPKQYGNDTSAVQLEP